MFSWFPWKKNLKRYKFYILPHSDNFKITGTGIVGDFKVNRTLFFPITMHIKKNLPSPCDYWYEILIQKFNVKWRFFPITIQSTLYSCAIQIMYIFSFHMGRF